MTKRGKRFTTLLLALCLCTVLCGLVPLSAYAAVPIEKVLATTSYVPVGTTPATDISASVSTYGCSLVSYGWYDNDSGQQITGKFTAGACHVELGIAAADGFYFPENVAAYINNSDTVVTRQSETYITVRRDYMPLLWEPNVIKSPGVEKVKEGEWASFVATANYAAGYTWKLTSPDGKTTIKCTDAPSKFPGLTVSEDNTEKMNLYKIPKELDGWKILCTFKGLGGSEVNSAAAKITVEPIGGAVTSPVPVTEPEKEEAAGEDNAAGEKASELDAETADKHEHEFSDEWSNDDDFHWHECECGERDGESPHNMSWTVISEASKKHNGIEEGVCSVCGYRVQKTLELQKQETDKGKLLLNSALGLCVLVIVIMVISAVKEHQRRVRRRRKKQRMNRY